MRVAGGCHRRFIDAETGCHAVWLQIAEQFGLPVISTSAGLVPFTLHVQDKEDFAPLSGVAIPVEMRAECGKTFKEALLFTHRGLSGPAVLQISSYWTPGQTITTN